MFESILTGLLNTSPIEAVSVVFGLVYSILAVKRVRWCWVAGGISSAILAVLAWKAKLPMQGVLQAYYVGMSVYGFWHWSREDGKAKSEVTTWPLRNHLIAFAAILVLSLITPRILPTGVSAAWPFLDSLVMWGSLLATWLTAQVKLENWLYWIVFDAIGIFLFVSQGLMFVALLFTVYLIVAAIGYVTWLRSRRAPAPLG